MAAAARSPVWLLAAALWLLALGAAALVGRQLLAARGGGGLDAAIRQIEAAIAGRRTALVAAGCTPEGVASATPPPRPAESTKLETAEIVRRLEHGVVLVLTGQMSGTGFFIAPDIVATNRHVVEGQGGGGLYITSKTLGQVIQGEVIATSPKGPIGAADFAIIRVPPVKDAVVLPLGLGVTKLEQVVVAGYPGMVLNRDQGFRRLLQGDVHSAPDLNINDGSISGVQVSASGISQVVHSALVLKGNSGGPLIDRCGSVVGINTFIDVDATQSGHINYALSATDLNGFLRAQNAPGKVNNVPCR